MVKLYFTVLALLCCINCFSQLDDSHKLDSLLIEGYAVEFILVKGGNFIMGSNNLDEELPAHSVSVHSFYLSKFEITQRIWNLVMGYNDSYHANCDDCPVDNVSWNDVQQFINKLNIATGKRYRLPTEAEWEFAASGGVYSKNCIYSGSNVADSVAWYFGNNSTMTHPVGLKKPNELGFYDMSGNISEWCNDWWEYHYYEHAPTNNPKGPSTGTKKVVRGGGHRDVSISITVKTRAVRGVEPDLVSKYYGFRLARDPN